jgi:immunity protein 26 of polymorphic toxin system
VARKRQAWSVGDIFTIQLKDGQHGLGQVVSQERRLLNSVGVAVFDCRVPSSAAASVTEPMVASAFAILFTTRDLPDSGAWRVVATGAVRLPKHLLPYEDLRASGFVGAKVVGSGILTKLFNAFYALAPWDDWHDPHYLDGLLLSPDKKPHRLAFKSSSERARRPTTR